MVIKKSNIDRNTSLVTAVFGVLGAFGLVSKLNLTVDQVAAALGLIAALGAAWRQWQEGKKTDAYIAVLEAAKRAPAILEGDDDAE